MQGFCFKLFLQVFSSALSCRGGKVYIVLQKSDFVLWVKYIPPQSYDLVYKE
jgi:hypothetical protein